MPATPQAVQQLFSRMEASLASSPSPLAFPYLTCHLARSSLTLTAAQAEAAVGAGLDLSPLGPCQRGL